MPKIIYYIITIIIVIATAVGLGPKTAKATLFSFQSNGQAIKVGEARFNQSHIFGPVEVIIDAQLNPDLNGPKGVHIHESGDLSKGCSSLCAHFNPFGAKHGGPSDNIFNRHIGDLGNVPCVNGRINARISDNLIGFRGPFNIMGRSLVIHEDEDDLGRGKHADSLETGHSGARIACGIVGQTTCGP